MLVKKNKRFGQKSKFWPKSKFWLTIEILLKNRNIKQENICFSKLKFIYEFKNQNYGQK